MIAFLAALPTASSAAGIIAISISIQFYLPLRFFRCVEATLDNTGPCSVTRCAKGFWFSSAGAELFL